MTSKPAAIPLFADAYLADTMHLSTEEHGAYLLLLMAAWRFDDCSLPDDDKKLARIVGLSVRRWNQIKDTVREFWTAESGRIFNARLRKERGYVNQKSESNRKNSRKRWGKQDTENIEDGSCERISHGNAPPPPPIEEEPNGSSPPYDPPSKKASQSKAKKLPMQPDWQPADFSGDVGEMLAEWPPGRLEAEVVDFREYWIEVGEKRPGWDRTFRSRIRAIHDRVMRENRNATRNSPTSGSPAAGYRGQDRRDGFTRAIDRAGGFDQFDEPAEAARRPLARDGPHGGDGPASAQRTLIA